MRRNNKSYGGDRGGRKTTAVDGQSQQQQPQAWRQKPAESSSSRGQQFPDQSLRQDRSQGSQSQGWQRSGRDQGGDRRGSGGHQGGDGDGRPWERQSESRGGGGGGRGSGERARGGHQGGDGDGRPWERQSESRGGGGGGRGSGERGRGGFRGGRGGQRPDFQSADKFPPSTVKFIPKTDEEIARITSNMSLIPFETPCSELQKGVEENWLEKIPLRESNDIGGTRGKKIRIEVNHLKLIFSNMKTAYHYDVTLNPDKISKKLARLVMEGVRKQFYPDRYPAFDGKKNLYASGQKGELFTENELHTTIRIPRQDPKPGDETFPVKVTIKRVETNFVVDLTAINDYLASRHSRELVKFPQEAIAVFDIALRNPCSLSLTQVKQSFFNPPIPGQEKPLGSGMELWLGFFQSATLGWDAYLNIDVAHKGFPQAKPVLDLMVDMKAAYRRDTTMKDLEKDGLKWEALEDFEKFIKGLKIKYHDPATKMSMNRRVIGVKQSADRTRFKLDDGPMITVQEYFKKHKNVTLKYPGLPLLHIGNPERTNYVPPEFCEVLPNQIIMKRLNKNQTTALIKEAAKPPEERKSRVMAAVEQANFNADKCVQEFGISVDNKFLEVSARILDAPKVEYKDKQVPVVNGVWNAQQFLSAQPLTKWVILSVQCNLREEDLWSFAENLMNCGRTVGMNIARPFRCDSLTLPRGNDYPLLNHFKSYPSDTQLVVVVFNERQSWIYDRVKFMTEWLVPRLTQCVKDRTMGRADSSIIKNILLKINTKLNGINHTINGDACRPSVRKVLEGAMLMGADVTHPDSKTVPSIAAVTASHEPYAFSYNSCMRMQPPKQEIILDMRAVVRRHLRVYIAQNDCPPKKIIYFRDGVSDGQFVKVLEAEMWAILKACEDVLGKMLPVTFIVVQKRHHTRFFLTRKQDGDRKGNVLPGTVVDTDITHPRENDFYLVSHAGIQGTSRPTKYHKLYDDNQISGHDLKDLTYYLCHMFPRCTRSVSYPAPTYLAHLAAARGKAYVSGSNMDLEDLRKEMESRTVHSSVMNCYPMFFT